MGRLPIVTVLCLMAAACSHERVTPAAADMSAREDLSATRDLSVLEDMVQEEDLATPEDLASRVDMALRGDLATAADLALPPGIQWVFANYNGAQTVWDPKKQWQGGINCPMTCGFVNRKAVGVRFVCNLHGGGATEGCTPQNDGKYGTSICGLLIDQGVKMSLNGNMDDCAAGNGLTDCVAGKCNEFTAYHALECQCAP